MIWLDIQVTWEALPWPDPTAKMDRQFFNSARHSAKRKHLDVHGLHTSRRMIKHAESGLHDGRKDTLALKQQQHWVRFDDATASRAWKWRDTKAG